MWARNAPHLYIGVAVRELCERLSPYCYRVARFSRFRVYPARIHNHCDFHMLLRRSIPYAESRGESERLKSVFAGWCRERSYDGAAESLGRDWERMVTFYDFPAEHWRHLRTTNVVESPFAALRLRTDAAKRFKRVDRAIAVIWKMLMVAESRFRRREVQILHCLALALITLNMGEIGKQCIGTLLSMSRVPDSEMTEDLKALRDRLASP